MRLDPEADAKYAIGSDVFRGEDLGIKPVPPDMMPYVKGVYVGGCVERGLGKTVKKGNYDAHAHIAPGTQYGRWVCFQRPNNLNDRGLRMHELAHVITREEGHTDRWRAVLERLGETIPPLYRKQVRKKRS